MLRTRMFVASLAAVVIGIAGIPAQAQVTHGPTPAQSTKHLKKSKPRKHHRHQKKQGASVRREAKSR